MAEKELRLGYVRGRDGKNGKDGKNGVDGKSPYQVAVEEGYTGTEEQLYAALASLIGAPFLPTAGGTMTGALNMGGQKISSLGTPVASTDAVTKDYVDKAKEALSRSIDGKTSKTPPAASGNLAALDAEGNLTDSGKKASDFTGKRVCRFVVGTSTAGWTAADCDYLCDGTDDQAEINAAIQALPSTGGEVVILDGTYNIYSEIIAGKSNLTIRGSGETTIFKRKFGTPVQFDNLLKKGIITANDIDFFAIKNLAFDGNTDEYPIEQSSIENYGIVLNNCNHVTIDGVLFKKERFSSIIYSCSYFFACKNTFVDCVGGFYFSGSNFCCCSENIFFNTSVPISLGSAVGQSTNNVASNNLIYNPDSGIEVEYCDNCVVCGNVIADFSREGISISNASKNLIAFNVAYRGSGTSSDYTESQYTIRLRTAQSNYNQVIGNLIMGKNYVSEHGTGNTFVDNKYQ